MPAVTIDPFKEAERKVSLATKSVERAIGQLVRLLGDEDQLVVARAFGALDVLGSRAIVGPLADGLARASTTIHRTLIVGALLRYDKRGDVRSIRALTAAIKKERHPELSGLIRSTLSTLIYRDVLARRPSSPSVEQGAAVADPGSPPTGRDVEGNSVGPPTGLSRELPPVEERSAIANSGSKRPILASKSST